MKNIFSKLLVFLFVLLYVSCQDDNGVILKQAKVSGPNIKIYEGTAANARKSSVLLKLQKSGKLINNRLRVYNSSDVMRGAEEDLEINYDKVMETEDSYGNKHLTYEAINTQAPETFFFNLVVTEKDGKTKIVLVTFEMDESFAADYAVNKKMENFKGIITFAEVFTDPDFPCDENPTVPIPVNPSDPNNPGGGGGGGGGGNSGPIGIDHGDPNASNQLLIDIKFLALQIAVSTQENWTDVHANPRYHRIAPILVDPSNPCGDGLEIGILEPHQPVVNNCNELKKLFTPDTTGAKLVPNIKPQIQWLEGKVDEQKEYGVEIKRAINFNGDMIYTPTQIQSESNFSLPFNQGNFYMGWIHSHPINGYGMFSFQDLKFLIGGYNLTSEQNKAEVFTIIVCRDKIDTTKTNTYALKVDDIAKLTTKINAIWNEYSSIVDEDTRINKIHDMQAEEYYYYENELEFSFLMQFPDSGISLYKADEQLNNWTKLELQDEAGFFPPLSVKQTPCN